MEQIKTVYSYLFMLDHLLLELKGEAFSFLKAPSYAQQEDPVYTEPLACLCQHPHTSRNGKIV